MIKTQLIKGSVDENLDPGILDSEVYFEHPWTVVFNHIPSVATFVTIMATKGFDVATNVKIWNNYYLSISEKQFVALF